MNTTVVPTSTPSSASSDSSSLLAGFVLFNIATVLAIVCSLANYVYIVYYSTPNFTISVLLVYRPKHRINTPAIGLSRVFHFLSRVLVLLLTLFATILIWSDGGGSGNMFTLSGVLSLFRSKGDSWIVGLWIELLLYGVVSAWFISSDSLEERLPPLYTIVLLVVVLFLPSIALGGHLVGRTILIWLRPKKAAIKRTTPVVGSDGGIDFA